MRVPFDDVIREATTGAHLALANSCPPQTLDQWTLDPPST